MERKAYPYQKSWKLVAAMIGFFIIFLVFLLWYIYAEEYCVAFHGIVLQDTIDSIKLFAPFMMAATMLGVVGTGIFLLGGFYIHTIVVSDQGMELQRKRGSILITKIDMVTEKNPNAFRVEGVAADGRQMKKMFGRSGMSVDDWSELKRKVNYLWERKQSGQQRVPHPPPPPPES